MKDRPYSWVVIAVLLFSVAVVLAASIFSSAFVRVHSDDDIIRVTGSAQQPIRSDFIIWDGKITDQAPTMTAAYSSLQADAAKVNSYFLAKGVPASEISPSSVGTTTLYVHTKGDTDNSPDSDTPGSGVYRQINGYELSQTFEIRSSNVDLIDNLSRRSTELISSGVPFESQPPEYLYTKLSDLKVQMLAAAGKDARNRAEQVATSTGCRIGDVRFARMGVLQIEPLYTAQDSSANEESDTGTNDTSSLDKKITAVVTAGFSIR